MTTAPADPASEGTALPYGIFAVGNERPRVGTRIGDEVIDLAALARSAGHPLADVLALPSLNTLMSSGPDAWRELRAWVADDAPTAESVHRYDLAQVTMRLPFDVADYVDFYASQAHATNVGKIFRPDSPGLPPNWKHLPIGYHGRAGTVVVSGTDVVRPSGQRRPESDGIPPFGPSTRLDIECEVGFVVGQPSTLGSPVPVEEAADHIFGVVLLNDWSARDIQAWEYVPLGPFLGKSFATSISAWVTPFAALDSARLPLAEQDPAVLPYLAGSSSTVFGLDLELEVTVNGQVVSEPHYRDMYWGPTQMLAHMTVNGASLRVGDLFASGTVSGTDPATFGSLLERTWNGTEPLDLGDGRRLTFLEDGDIVTLTGRARNRDGSSIVLGEVAGRIVAAN